MREQLSTSFRRETTVPEDYGSSSDEMRALAAAFGYVLGAASLCPSIEEARVAVATDRLSDFLRAYRCGSDEREICAAIFKEGISDGKESLTRGEIDDAFVETALRRTERVLVRWRLTRRWGWR